MCDLVRQGQLESAPEVDFHNSHKCRRCYPAESTQFFAAISVAVTVLFFNPVPAGPAALIYAVQFALQHLLHSLPP